MPGSGDDHRASRLTASANKMKTFTQFLPLLTSLAVASPIDLNKSGLHELFVRQDIQTPINASLPNVTIFATGGTIASQGSRCVGTENWVIDTIS